MFKRIALISENASPLATAGEENRGGQQGYVANLAHQLARLGYSVDVLTRKTSATLPDMIDWEKRVRIVNLRAGPALSMPQEEVLAHLDEFTTNVINFIRREGNYDLIYANFWMSGIVAARVKTLFQVPFVLPFHALGKLPRASQGTGDEFAQTRYKIQEWVVGEADEIIVQGLEDKQDLMRYYHAAPGKILILPRGFDGNEFYRVEKEITRNQLRPFRNRFPGFPWGRKTPRPFPQRSARP
jgi:D-inositol-3-phosphate glycosyltransferase